MKLWILRSRINDPEATRCWDRNPWRYEYGDGVHGIVVRASTQKEARALANVAGGGEKRNHAVWEDPRYTTCERLLLAGDAEVILCVAST